MMNATVIDYRFYIRKILYSCLILMFWFPLKGNGQKDFSITKNLRAEQDRFVGNIKEIKIDTSIVYPIARYVDSEIDAIYRDITRRRSVKTPLKEKALRSTIYFLTELGRSLQFRKFDVYSIPGAFASYRRILDALMRKSSLDDIGDLDPRQSQLMAAAFTQYEEYRYLGDLAVYKRVASSPEYIFQFLESRPDFRFADSLVVIAAAHDPQRVIHYLGRGKDPIIQRIRQSTDPHLQQIVAISGEKNASELVPFLKQLQGEAITTAGITTARAKPTQYFQLLVNTLIQTNAEGNGGDRFTRPLRTGLRQKALAFYANVVNELHDSPEATRFSVVKGLRPEDLYYIITSSGEDLYTSSYLGLYKRLKSHFNGNADSIFRIVQYDNFHVFMRLAANYNVLADFLSQMPLERAQVLLHRYISSIGTDPAAGVETAMDIADSFGALASAPQLVQVAETELVNNVARVKEARQYLGMRLYNILSQVFHLVKEDGNVDKLWVKLGNYELLQREELKNDRGEIVELVLFYGDDDGVASFRNFLKLYSDTNKWKVTRNENWINIRSVSDEPVNIFANVPLSISEGLDIQAQDALVSYLDAQGLEPSILVHRGHSYHLEKTLNRLKPSVKLAILGSCGGYNKAISIASINPDAHIIGSKKVGAMVINDPLIDVINTTLAEKNDLSWPDIWEKLNKRFSKSPVSLSLFSEYFPPSTNIGLFVLKLFRNEGRDA